MKLGTVGFGLLCMSTGIVITASVLHAAPPTPTATTPTRLPTRTAPKAAPAALTPSAKVARLGRFVSAAALQKISIKLLHDFHVGPATPRDAAGARMTFMGAGMFWPAGPGAPVGSFVSSPAGPGGFDDLAMVTLEIPSEPNKLYAFDCRLQTPAQPGLPPTTFSACAPQTQCGTLVNVQHETVTDGHLVGAVRGAANATSTEVLILWHLGAVGSPDTGAFYGCEIDKAD